VAITLYYQVSHEQREIRVVYFRHARRRPLPRRWDGDPGPTDGSPDLGHVENHARPLDQLVLGVQTSGAGAR
jgi:hypothetical protein